MKFDMGNYRNRIIFLIIAVFVCAAVYYLTTGLGITLKQINEPYVAVNQEFDIRNYFSAGNIRGKDISDRIQYDGKVDTSREGDYPVKVSVKGGLSSKSETDVTFHVIPVQIPATMMEDLKGKYVNLKDRSVLSFYDNYGKAKFSFSVIGGKEEYEGSVGKRVKGEKTDIIVLFLAPKYDGSKKQQFRFETINLHRKGKILKVYDLFNRKETAFEYAGNDWESVYRFMRK